MLSFFAQNNPHELNVLPFDLSSLTLADYGEIMAMMILF